MQVQVFKTIWTTKLAPFLEKEFTNSSLVSIKLSIISLKIKMAKAILTSLILWVLYEQAIKTVSTPLQMALKRVTPERILSNAINAFIIDKVTDKDTDAVIQLRISLARSS